MAFGFPVGDSLGVCGVCGGNFLMQVITGENFQTVHLGGTEIAVHKEKCLDVLIGMVESDGMIDLTKYELLPEKSPIRRAMKKAIENHE